jgi:hypothetical protein
VNLDGIGQIWSNHVKSNPKIIVYKLTRFCIFLGAAYRKYRFNHRKYGFIKKIHITSKGSGSTIKHSETTSKI